MLILSVVSTFERIFQFLSEIRMIVFLTIELFERMVQRMEAQHTDILVALQPLPQF